MLPLNVSPRCRLLCRLLCKNPLCPIGVKRPGQKAVPAAQIHARLVPKIAVPKVFKPKTSSESVTFPLANVLFMPSVLAQ